MLRDFREITPKTYRTQSFDLHMTNSRLGTSNKSSGRYTCFAKNVHVRGDMKRTLPNFTRYAIFSESKTETTHVNLEWEEMH